MSDHYEEIFQGEAILRRAPSARHESICARLHSFVASSLLDNTTTRLLVPRSPLQLGAGTLLRPDLALVTVATGKPWLLAEIVESGDHHTDTVTKKTIYEDLRIPRLWMIDPRYDNVEIYEATEYGLVLRGILAHREFVEERSLPLLHISIAALFGLEPRH
jgi:putative restriction endonuclease